MATTVKMRDTEAACWVWRALWEERKRRQKAVKQREESGAKQWWNAAAAPNLLELRLIDAVLYEANSTKPSHGLFTAKTGELMRRASTSLEPSAVQARMAQVALGVFGGGAAATAAAAAATVGGASKGGSGSGSGDGGASTPAIAVAYLADGSVRELRGGAAWDTFVGASTRTGLLRAITPFAAPLCSPSNDRGSSSSSGSSVVRLRNVYRLVTEGSQIGKVQTTSQRVVLRGTGASKSVYGAAAVKSSATNAAQPSSTREQGGAGSADALVLVPSRAGALNRRLDAASLQIAKLLEASCLAGTVSVTGGQASGVSAVPSSAPRRARVRRFVADYLVQPPSASSHQATADVGEHAGERSSNNGGNGQKRQNSGGHGGDTGGGSERNRGKSEGSGEAVVWFERCVELELEESPPLDNAPSGTQTSTAGGGNGTAPSVSSPNSASVVAPTALPRLVKNNGSCTTHGTAGGASSGSRSCCGDFCAFDTLQELSVMEGDSSALSMGSPPRRADKVVAFRSISAARQDAAQILRRVAAHFVPGGGRGGLGGGLGGGGDAECIVELREGLEDQGWPLALAHWWLRARAGIPIGPAAGAGAAAIPTKAGTTSSLGRNVGNAPSPLPGKPPLNYNEPKRLLCTSPSDVPPEVWWPGRLVEVCWASSGPLAWVSVWLQDEAGFCVAVAPRAPNSGRLVCVIPATLTSRLAASRGVATTSSTSEGGRAAAANQIAAAGGRGKSGTNGWVFRVRVCDAYDPAVECWSTPVMVVASEKDVLPEDKARKPHEQLEFEERVRRRRVEEWRASHVASDAAAAAANARSPLCRQPQQLSSGITSPTSNGISNGATSQSVVGALRALKLGETDVLGPSGSAAMIGGGAASTNGLAHLPLHQLYREVKVCSTCYGVYKELDQARRQTEERDARDAKKHALRQKLVKEQVRKEFAAHGASVGQSHHEDAASASGASTTVGLGPDGDLAEAVALPALAAALTQQQRAVSERLARPRHPSAIDPNAAIQPGAARRGKTQGTDSTLPRVPGATAAAPAAAPTAGAASTNAKKDACTVPGAYQRPVWQQLKDHTYGGSGENGAGGSGDGSHGGAASGERGGAGTSSSFVRHIGERAARLKAAAAAAELPGNIQQQQPRNGKLRGPPSSEPPQAKSHSKPKPPPPQRRQPEEELRQLEDHPRGDQRKRAKEQPLALPDYPGAGGGEYNDDDDCDDDHSRAIERMHRELEGGPSDAWTIPQQQQQQQNSAPPQQYANPHYRGPRSGESGMFSDAQRAAAAAEGEFGGPGVPSGASRVVRGVAEHPGVAVLDELQGPEARRAMEAEAAALAAQAIQQQRQRLQQHRAHQQLGGATSYASGTSSDTTAALGPAPHTTVGPDGRLPDGRYPDRLPPRKTQQQLLRQQQRKRRLNGQSSSSQGAKPRGSAFYDRFLHGYQREAMAEMRTRAAIEKQAKDMNLGLTSDQIDALLAASLQGGSGISNSDGDGNDDSAGGKKATETKTTSGKPRAKSKSKRGSSNIIGSGKGSPKNSPTSKNKTRTPGIEQSEGRVSDAHQSDDFGSNDMASAVQFAGSPDDTTIGYGDGGAASTSLSRRSIGGFGGGGSLAEAIGSFNAKAAAHRVRGGQTENENDGRIRGHQGEAQAGKEDCDDEFDELGEENDLSGDNGDSNGGSVGSIEVGSHEAWRQKWAAGSADSEDNEASSDEDAEEEKSLAEYQDTQRRLAKQQDQQRQEQQEQSPQRSPEASAAALQDLLAQAAAAAAGGGAADFRDSASVAALLEQLAAKARQLDVQSTSSGGSGGTASPLVQSKKKVQAAAPQAPSSTKVPKAAAPKAAAPVPPPPGQPPVVRCAFCNLLPAARQCMDCPISGCAACWARAHKAPDLRNHRFELMGLAKAQVADMLAEAAAFADGLHSSTDQKKSPSRSPPPMSPRAANVSSSGSSSHDRDYDDDERTAVSARDQAYLKSLTTQPSHAGSPIAPRRLDPGHSPEDKLAVARARAQPQSYSSSTTGGGGGSGSSIDGGRQSLLDQQLEDDLAAGGATYLSKEQPRMVNMLSAEDALVGYGLSALDRRFNDEEALVEAGAAAFAPRDDSSKARVEHGTKTMPAASRPPPITTRRITSPSDDSDDDDDDDDDDEEGMLPAPSVVLPSASSSGYGKDSFDEGADDVKFDDNDDDDDDDDDEIEWSPIKDQTAPAVADSANSSNRVHESASGAADASSTAPWARELASMVEQGEQERARLTAQLEQEAARQAASLQERIADRKRSQRLGSSRQGRSSSSSSSSKGGGLTPSMGSPTAHRGKGSASTSPTLGHRPSPKAPHSPTNGLAHGTAFMDPQRASAESAPGGTGAGASASFSADWVQREWDSAQDDHAAQLAAVGGERSRQRAATCERLLSRQGGRRSSGGANSGDGPDLPLHDGKSTEFPPESPPLHS